MLDPTFVEEVVEGEVGTKACGKVITYAQQWTRESVSEVEAGLLWSFQGKNNFR
jgi:hypothetical protein